LGGLEIDHQLVFCRGLHGKVGSLFALEDAIDVAGGAAELIEEIHSIADETAYPAIETIVVDCGQSMPSGQRNDQIAVRGRRRTARDNKTTIRALRESRDGTLDLRGIPHIDGTQLDAERRRHGLDGAELTGSGRDAGIAKDRCARYARCDLLENLQELASDAIFK